MNNEEILTKAIEKAVKGGYQWSTLYWSQNILKQGVIEHIIFSHSFAKAFWGDDDIKIKAHWKNVLITAGGGHNRNITRWQYHLQQMVLEENPLNYLSKFL